MASAFRSISRVSAFTLISRVLGLLRDILFFAGLGSGAVTSAFVIAFTLPNLFRRLLGEGALTSASIPVLSEMWEKDGRVATFRVFSGILSRLSLLLWALTLLVWIVAEIVPHIPGLEDRWYHGAELTQWLFPYVIFICLSALTSALLQLLNRFDLPALSQVWLNLMMIVALAVGIWWTGDDPELRVRILAVGVLLGGVLQWWLPRRALKSEGWKPAWSLEPHPRISQLWSLLLPGLLGAAIFQINIFLSRLLAFSIDDTAAGFLYLSNRLLELPLGVFAIAVSIVLFPQLSRMAARQDQSGFSRLYWDGLRLIALIILPATVGLIMLGEPVLRVLFQWGLFSEQDVLSVLPVLQATVIGMPFFAWSTYLTRGFHARQDMKTPVRYAGWNLLVNLILSVALMIPYGAVGLALANSIAALIHCVFLQARVNLGKAGAEGLASDGYKILFACLVMGIFASGSWKLLQAVGFANPKWSAFIAVGPGILLSIGIYFGLLYLMRVRLGLKEVNSVQA